MAGRKKWVSSQEMHTWNQESTNKSELFEVMKEIHIYTSTCLHMNIHIYNYMFYILKLGHNIGLYLQYILSSTYVPITRKRTFWVSPGITTTESAGSASVGPCHSATGGWAAI